MFFLAANKIKTILKLLFSLLILNSRILSLIWEGTIYFVQSNKTIFLPSGTRQASYRTQTTQFFRLIESLYTNTVSYSSLFRISYVLFSTINPNFRVYSMPSPAECERSCLTSLNAFSVTHVGLPTCLILIGQFKFQAPASHIKRKRFKLAISMPFSLSSLHV